MVLDLEHPYAQAALGQRDPPSVEQDLALPTELLRADSLWAAGRGAEAVTVLDQLEAREDWDAQHFGAIAKGLRALVGGDLDAAYQQYARAAGQDVDVFAAERAVNIAFWMACAGKMLAAATPLESVVETRPFAGGVLAFAQHMTGDSEKSLSTAKSAVAKGFDDPWTLHAVAHSLYSLGKSQECALWLVQHRGNAAACNTFMKTHMEFHLGMCLLDLQDAKGLEDLLDGPLWGSLSAAEKTDYWAATGPLNILWKAALRGVEVHSTTTANVVNSSLEQLEAADVSKSRVFSLCILRWTLSPSNTWLDKIRAVGDEVFTAVADAINAAYQNNQNWVAAADNLAPVAHRLHELGASPEQREVIEEFMVVAFKAAGRPLEQHWKTIRRANVPWYDQLIDSVHVRKKPHRDENLLQ